MGWRWSNSVSSDAIDGGVGRGQRRVCSALSGHSRTDFIPQPLPTVNTTVTSPVVTKQNGTSTGKVTTSRPKGQLSAPQKRLNHIMSEQKRRNAIRDGYVQLTALLAPAGAPPGTGMPTRGRPKGSGNRGKGKCQGKSGILFRAVDYCRFMEENLQALRDEVARVEAAAAGNHQVLVPA